MSGGLRRFVLDVLVSGSVGGIVSHAVASVCSKREHGRSELPMRAVSHIAWNDAPDSHEDFRPRGAVIGTALHHGACFFWATFFEALFGERAERDSTAALAGGATIATAAYITDYYIVSDRFKPGFEAYLPPRALFLVYAGLALGFAAGARLRGLSHHEPEDRDEREKGRKAERGPDAVVAPESRR
jgi:hypothetical protein